jgi:superfamily II DNA/RNA helicase
LIQGIDIPDIQLVVQYQLPASLSVLWQRLGQAARNPSIQATGIVLVEAKYFSSEKAKRQKAAETRMANRRKRKHQELLDQSAAASPSRSCSPDLSNADSSDYPCPSPASTLFERPSTIRQRIGRTNCKLHTLEKGLDQFINSHMSGHTDQRCRRKAINSYFENPVEGSEHLIVIDAYQY